MKIILLTVGKTDQDWVSRGIEMYSSRLVHYVRFEISEIPELKKVSSFSREQIKEKEGELILSYIKPSDVVVLLDPRGKEYDSPGFASLLQKFMNMSAGTLFFVVGGAYGFSEKVYDRSDYMLSLSKMTFSHQIVRVLFLEQLYRGFSILRNEPYHH